MAKIPYVDIESSAETREQWQRLASSRGPVGIPTNFYRLLAHSPKIMMAWSALAQSLRGFDHAGSFDPEMITVDVLSRELVIMQVSALNHASYDFDAHASFAIQKGISPAQVEGLRRGDTVTEFTARERALLSYATELTRSVNVREEVLAALREHYDVRQCLELTVLISFYNCVSRVMVGLSVDKDDPR